MLPLSNAELAALRSVQTSSMRDRCVLLVPQSTVSPITGKPLISYVDGVETICGLGPPSGNASQGQEVLDRAEVPIVDAELRLPLTVSVDHRMRVRIIERAGQAITPEVYAVVGASISSGTAQLIHLTRVIDGSTGGLS